jgi:FtsH-binding integral membrane protein
MAELRYQTRSDASSQAQIDAGLRSYMLGVYNYMALGVALTAIIVMAVAASPAVYAVVAPFNILFFFALLGLGFFGPRLIFSGSEFAAHAAYWAYCALWGLMLAPMVVRYLHMAPDIVYQAFLISAATFGATSLAGYVTKRDLSGLAGFFTIASIGLVIAILVNAFFFHSTMASLGTSVIVVLLFAGVTAYETQMIKQWYVEGDLVGVAKRKSIFGAMQLYGSFVTLFVHILNILGIMRNN